VIEMSRGAGVVELSGGAVGEPPPLPADAFRRLGLDALPPHERTLCDALAPGSARLAGATAEVRAAAEALRPFVVEALSYLRTFEERFVREGERNERAPVDFYSHVRRYAFTLSLVRAHAARSASASGRPLRILDVGGPGIISDALRADPRTELYSTAGDLRAAFTTGPHPSYDLVLCSEVIEHVSDPQVGYCGDSRFDYNAEVCSVGARHVLARLAGVVDPQGAMLLTTPNAVSLYALRELGQRRPGAIYRPHYREYTPGELLDLLRGAGVDAVLTTCEVYAFYDLREEIEYLRRVGAPDARRFWGDTILAYAWRPERGDAGVHAADLEAVARAFAREEIASALGLDALAADRLP
jgi:methyltransferase family protein